MKKIPSSLRDAADTAVCRYLEDFRNEEIRDAIAGVNQCIAFEHEGRSYLASFYMPSDDLVDLEGDELDSKVAQVIADMDVVIEEADEATD